MALVMICLGALPAMADVTKTDVKKLLDAGISDNVIVEYVKANAPVRMTASELISLKSSGATDNVLTVLAQYMSTAAPAPTQVTTETVYVYEPYYHTWYWGGYWGWYPRYYYRPVYRPVYRPATPRHR
jgi:hypothetical protein